MPTKTNFKNLREINTMSPHTMDGMESARRCSRFAPTGSVYIVRHGQRADHADEHWHETAERPHDPHLTDTGLQQALSTGMLLSSERVDAIYSSPFLRCMQTAAAIAKPHNLKIRVEPGLGEMLADCEEHGWGFTEDPYDEALSAERLAKQFPVDTTYQPLWDSQGRGVSCSRWSKGTAAVCFPESWDEAKSRYQDTLMKLKVMAPFSVLVSHGAGVMSMAESILAPDDVDDCSYCCVTQIHQSGGGAWRCTQHGTSHHGLMVSSTDQLVLQR